MKADFAHLWQQMELSDIDLVLRECPQGGAPFEAEDMIRKIPAHKAILTLSLYFRSQFSWEEQQQQQQGQEPDQQQPPRKRGRKASVATKTQGTQLSRPTVTLTLESRDQEPAALAVLAALYGASPPIRLTDVQTLDMILLADKLQLSEVADQAVDAFAVFGYRAGLSEAAKQQLLALPAWPSCLLEGFPKVTPHMHLLEVASAWVTAAAPANPASLEELLAAPHSEHMLDKALQELGDLEKVWQDAEDQKVLLGLPLPVMQLLLTSSRLTAAKEDTVMYTAQAFVNAQPTAAAQQAAKQQLAPLIRAPYLSHFHLSAVSREFTAPLLLDGMRYQVGELLAYLQVQATGLFPSERFKQLVPTCPASWLQLPRRYTYMPTSVRMMWKLPVNAVREACMTAHRDAKTVKLASDKSPPLFGIAYRLSLACTVSKEEPGAVRIGLYVDPQDLPRRMYCCYGAALSVDGHQGKHYQSCTISGAEQGWGFPDFFSTGYMADGFNETAWLNKSLPPHY